MSRILKGMLHEANPHNYDSDIDYYDALNRKPRVRPEPDYSEPEDPYADIYRKQDAAMAQHRKDVNVQHINKEGSAPNGERYNSAFIVRSVKPEQGDNEIYKFNDAHWGAKKIVDTVKKKPDEQGEPYTTIVYYVDNHKHGYWTPFKGEPPISKGVEFGEAKEEEYGPEWDEKVKRVGQLAKEGPRKTVWDPVKRVYKTVPVNEPKKEGMVMGVSTDASSAGTIGEGVNHSALQGWDEMDPGQKRLALDAAGVMSRYDTAFKSSSELDDILHAARVKAQNQEDELNIGASGRRELQRQAKQDFEAQRQQLHKEKMEMERFAWEKANTEAERKHEINKIEKEYLHDLRRLQMAHDHDMQKILHADTHELNKMKAEFNMRQKEREQGKPKPQPPEQQSEPDDGDNFDQDTGEPLKPGVTRPQSNQWHTSQQVGYTPTKPTKPNKDDDVTDVEPKPNRPLALGNSVKENSSSVLRGLALHEEAHAAKTDDKLRAYYAQLKAKKLAAQKPESNKEQGNDNMRMDAIDEDWQKTNKKDKTDGMSRKAVKAYRRENPGSKLKTAVTTKPSKLKKGSKSAKRRKSFCARMSGMKKSRASAKTKRDPDSPINKALRRWNCESIEQLHELMMIAEQKVQQLREAANPAQQAAIAISMKKKGQKPKQESSIIKGLVDENLGTPYPGTYEQETAPIRRPAKQERVMKIAFEGKKNASR